MAVKGQVNYHEDSGLISLPVVKGKPMKVGDAVKTLQALEKELESVIAIEERFEAPLIDAAIAFSQAVRDTLGTIQGGTSRNWFTGEVLAQAQIKRIQGPGGVNFEAIWGRVQLAGKYGDGFLQTNLVLNKKRPVLVIQGQTRRKYEDEIQEIFALTRELLKKQSIYRGHAVRMHDEGFDPESDDPFLYAPTFIDTAPLDEKDLVFNDEVMEQITASVLNPIRYRERAQRVGSSFRRGVLLAGSYGVGKTLLAAYTAGEAVKHGITFIHLPNASQIASTIEFAAQYQPAVVFCEDIDRVTKGERSEALDAILNTVDGAESKTRQVMLVFTTNHLSDINKAMVRSGRLDAVLHIPAPNAMSVTKLIRLYGKEAVPMEVSLTKVGTMLAGSIPADIREVVERAKLAALPYMIDGKPLVLVERDLEVAARGFLAERELLNVAPAKAPGVIDRAAEAFVGAIAAQMELVDRMAPSTVAKHAKQLTAALGEGV